MRDRVEVVRGDMRAIDPGVFEGVAAVVERYLFASSCSIYDQGVEDPDADVPSVNTA